jgi:hypothetical protein
MIGMRTSIPVHERYVIIGIITATDKLMKGSAGHFTATMIEMDMVTQTIHAKRVKPHRDMLTTIVIVMMGIEMFIRVHGNDAIH